MAFGLAQVEPAGPRAWQDVTIGAQRSVDLRNVCLHVSRANPGVTRSTPEATFFARRGALSGSVRRAPVFHRGDDRSFAQRIRRDPPILLHRRAPQAPHALQRVIMRADREACREPDAVISRTRGTA